MNISPYHVDRVLYLKFDWGGRIRISFVKIGMFMVYCIPNRLKGGAKLKNDPKASKMASKVKTVFFTGYVPISCNIHH